MATTTQAVEIKNFIDGEQRETAEGASEPILNPATGEQIATAPLSGEADVDAAVQAAKRAFEEWSETTPGERSIALLRIADALEENADELSRARVARRGQADRGHARGGDAVPRRQRALLRGSGALHGGTPGRRVHARLHVDAAAGAGGRRRAGGAVELPADDGDLEDRSGAGGGQHRRAEALRADADDGIPAGADLRRAPAQGSVERDLRTRRAGGRGSGAPPRRGDGLADG